MNSKLMEALNNVGELDSGEGDPRRERGASGTYDEEEEDDDVVEEEMDYET